MIENKIKFSLAEINAWKGIVMIKKAKVKDDNLNKIIAFLLCSLFKFRKFDKIFIGERLKNKIINNASILWHMKDTLKEIRDSVISFFVSDFDIELNVEVINTVLNIDINKIILFINITNPKLLVPNFDNKIFVVYRPNTDTITNLNINIPVFFINIILK